MKEVFEFYNSVIKPIYSEVEARDNTLPVELLFEIHAAFDHLKRVAVDGKDEKIHIEKAISHLKRGALDAFKLKLKSYNNDCNALINSGVDLTLIDSGEFHTNFFRDKSSIIKKATEARKQEGTNIENAFTIWSEVSVEINSFYDSYLDKGAKLAWAKNKSLKIFTKSHSVGFIFGIIASVIASCIYSFFRTLN